jgi:hypothetical protein
MAHANNAEWTVIAKCPCAMDEINQKKKPIP